MKTVRFDVQSVDKPNKRMSGRSRPRRLKEPSPKPREVYGLYLPNDACLALGLEMSHREYPPVLSAGQRQCLVFMGIRCANSHCLDKFPHIPLRWRTYVYVTCAEGLHPLVVLGHRHSSGRKTIYVNDEQVEELRAYLQLGDQQPAWYRIEHI